MARPRLNVGAPVTDVAPIAAASTEVPEDAVAERAAALVEPAGGGGGAERWVRPATSPADAVPVPGPLRHSEEFAVAPVAAGVGVHRRSPARKRNRTVSIPADTVTATRLAARAAGLSLSDWTFVRTEEFCERLRSNPQMPQREGRVVAPRGAAATKAHLVLYMADDEWEKWRDLAVRGGLQTISALVSAALV